MLNQRTSQTLSGICRREAGNPTSNISLRCLETQVQELANVSSISRVLPARSLPRGRGHLICWDRHVYDESVATRGSGKVYSNVRHVYLRVGQVVFYVLSWIGSNQDNGNSPTYVLSADVFRTLAMTPKKTKLEEQSTQNSNECYSMRSIEFKKHAKNMQRRVGKFQSVAVRFVLTVS